MIENDVFNAPNKKIFFSNFLFKKMVNFTMSFSDGGAESGYNK